MMTREEIDRHVAGILALRKRNNYRRAARARYDRGSDTGSDFDPARRRVYGVALRDVDAGVGAVDTMFDARQRAGWLPRGGGRD